jgi:hypothetical protein
MMHCQLRRYYRHPIRALYLAVCSKEGVCDSYLPICHTGQLVQFAIHILLMN